MISRVLKAGKRTEQDKEENHIRIGILGAANIAPPAIVYPAGRLASCDVIAVAARNKKKAEKFAKKHSISMVFDSYEDLINSSDVDMVYIPLPNGFHAYYTVLSLEAGKHVLSEKPMASNEEEVDLIISAQRDAAMNSRTGTQAQVFCAYHYRFHPATLRLRNSILDGDYGEIVSFDINLTIPGLLMGKSDIRFNAGGKNKELAGGSLMDLGCYAVSWFRLVAETALLGINIDSFLGHEIISSKLKEAFKDSDKRGVDQSAVVELKLFDESNPDKEILGRLKTNFKGWGLSMKLRITGTKKEVSMTNPLLPWIYHSVTEKNLKTKKKIHWKEYGNGESTYYYQLESIIKSLNGDEEILNTTQWAAGLAHCKQNMAIIDAIYTKAGFEPRQGKR